MSQFDIPHPVHDYLSWLSACLMDSDVRSVREYLRSCKEHCNYRFRRVRRRSAGNVVIRDLLFLFAGSDWTCLYCGCRLSLEKQSEVRASLDHIRPFSQGGTNAIENLVPACSTCNRRKGSRHFLSFCDDVGAFTGRYDLMWSRYCYYLSSSFLQDIHWFRLKWLTYDNCVVAFS